MTNEHDELIARERLTAAAPELLAALEHLLGKMHSHLLDMDGDQGRDLGDAMHEARIAVAKAKGEA